ncbi:MAG: hypothetical protein QW724_02260 [Nitrososphaerota archaeon]
MRVLPRRQARWESYYNQVEETIHMGSFINGVSISPQKLPPSQTTRQELDKVFKICSNRDFRVILVEDIDDYKVFIQIPDGKSECDFYVWYAKFASGKLVEVKVPTHDDLATWYNQLKGLAYELNEYLINAILRLVRDREAVKDIVEKYFGRLRKEHKIDVTKFLSTLKWISLEEDTNYPPPKMMGSKYTLALYALLEAGFNMSEIRRVIKF